MRNRFVLVLGALLLICIGVVFAQEEVPVPPFYKEIFSAAMYKAIVMIIGFTQMIKNMLNARGWFAIAIAFVVSLGYSFITFLDQGFAFCVITGLAAAIPAASAWWALRKIGKMVNPQPDDSK